MTHVVGIDVSKVKLDVALRRPDGTFRSKVVENSPSGFATLTAWLGTQGVTQVHACLEATGSIGRRWRSQVGWAKRSVPTRTPCRG